MGKNGKAENHLPLSESTYYILLALVQPMHGYGVMQATEHISGGAVKIGPGTLYGAFSTLQEQGLIELVREENRRKVYALTEMGRDVLAFSTEACQDERRSNRCEAEKTERFVTGFMQQFAHNEIGWSTDES